MADIWAAVLAMRTQSRAMRGSPLGLILGVVQPVVFLLITAGTQRASTVQRSTELVIGVGLTALWGSTIWSAGGILRSDRFQGTLARSLTTVRSVSAVFLGKCVAATARMAGAISVSTVAAAVVLGLPLRVRQPGWMLLGFALVVLSATGLGTLLSCLFLVTRHATAWSAALMYPVFIVSGMIIPLEMIPTGLRPVSLVISLRWGAEFLVTAANGDRSSTALAALVGLTCLYFAVALTAFRWLLHRGRREGTLDDA